MEESHTSGTIMESKRLMPYGAMILLIMAFFWLYHQVIVDLVKDWMSDDNYSHGFFIPLISGYIVWNSRKKLAEQEISPANSGIVFLILGLVVFVLGYVGAELFTMRFSMLIVLFGLVVFLWGWGIAKIVFCPIAYLAFMIPLPAILWNQIAFPLKLFATKLAYGVISALGIAVYREGNILHLTTTTLEVADACSGLRSLTSLLALSGAFALLSNHSCWKKLALFISAIPIAILVNIFRLAVTAILATFYGEKVAQGFLHEASGVIVFILAIALLYCVHLVLLRISSGVSDAYNS